MRSGWDFPHWSVVVWGVPRSQRKCCFCRALFLVFRWTQCRSRTLPHHGVLLFSMSVQKQPTMGLGVLVGLDPVIGLVNIGPSLMVRVERLVNQSSWSAALVFKSSAPGWMKGEKGAGPAMARWKNTPGRSVKWRFKWGRMEEDEVWWEITLQSCCFCQMKRNAMFFNPQNILSLHKQHYNRPYWLEVADAGKWHAERDSYKKPSACQIKARYDSPARVQKCTGMKVFLQRSSWPFLCLWIRNGLFSLQGNRLSVLS